MSRGTELRAPEIARLRIRVQRASVSGAAVVRRSERTRSSSASDDEQGGCQGAKSQRAVASNQILQEQFKTMQRRNKLRRFSRTPEGSADNISGVLSCSRIPTLAVEKAACIINTRHSHVAPLRVARGVLATPAKRVPRDLAPTLCRVLMMQAVLFAGSYSSA
jgi:hypothetical protein